MSLLFGTPLLRQKRPPAPPERVLGVLLFAIELVCGKAYVAGAAGIPKHRPLLFVSNHQIIGLDMLAFIAITWIRFGVALRGLGDRAHFHIPGWAAWLRLNGAVVGTRPNCAHLMETKQATLVYPGGADEILRKKKDFDAGHSLIWRNRKGFAAMALQHECTIVPVASVGLDESFWVLGDVSLDWLMRLVGDKRRGVSFPIVVPKLGCFPPRLYFKFCAPIKVERPADADDAAMDAAASLLRDRTRDEILAGIEELRRVRRVHRGESFE